MLAGSPGARASRWLERRPVIGSTCRLQPGDSCTPPHRQKGRAQLIRQVAYNQSVKSRTTHPSRMEHERIQYSGYLSRVSHPFRTNGSTKV